MKRNKTSTTVQELPNGTLITTIPKTFTEIVNISKGDLLFWNIKDNKITVDVVKKEEVK